MDYTFGKDVYLTRKLLALTQKELASILSVDQSRISRWEKELEMPEAKNLQDFYLYAYSAGIDLNYIKSQFYFEDSLNRGLLLLFHGSKSGIKGTVKHDVNRESNDFGLGFYCGDSFKQSRMFISNYDKGCVYIAELNETGLKESSYTVNTDWMLSVAYHRGKLKNYQNSLILKDILNKHEDTDVIKAPIADNRMYRIIDDFIDGLITDKQAEHALSATDLGMQYILRTPKAIANLYIKERCFLSAKEKNYYMDLKRKDRKQSVMKAEAARIKYRREGKYIDELL